MRLPPYGKSIDNSQDPVWIWAGEELRVNQTVKHLSGRKNEIAFYPPNDPKHYTWFVKNRMVLLIHFFEAGNVWIKTIARALLKSGATQIVEISMPYMGSWWNQHHNIYTQFLEVCGYDRSDQFTMNHYLRS